MKHLMSVLGALLICSPMAQAQLFDDNPDVILCSVSQGVQGDNWDKFVFYISGKQLDGGVLYKSLTSNPVLITVDASGNVSAPNLADCDNTTVEQLKKRGQTRVFSR